MYFKAGIKQSFDYLIASLNPYNAAEQRTSNKSNFMYSGFDIACPYPLCGARFRFLRTKKKL